MAANNQAMREAFVTIGKCMDEILVRTELDSIIHRKALEAQNLADSALMEPPRNCDVGTAEEQSKRFSAFCNDHNSYNYGCKNCPCRNSRLSCVVLWAQMPYTEGGDAK